MEEAGDEAGEGAGLHTCQVVTEGFPDFISRRAPRSPELKSLGAGRIEYYLLFTQIVRPNRPTKKAENSKILFKGHTQPRLAAWHNPIDLYPGIWNWDEASDLPRYAGQTAPLHLSWRNVREDSGFWETGKA